MVTIEGLHIGITEPLTIIAGPCVIENEEMILETARTLKQIVSAYPVQFIFKSSYRKANRTSVRGFTGLPFEEALGILDKIKKEIEVPVLTDVHTELEIPLVAEVVDVLQIPAFLSRQTDLLLAAGKTGKAVNIKKGQFLAPEDMEKAAEKITSVGNRRILLTERGTAFGYRNLVVDMRSLLVMKRTGFPVVYDATHSVQIPGGLGEASGGQPEFIIPLAVAALSTGAVSAVFMEVHPNPSRALSDAASQLSLSRFSETVERLLKIYQVMQDSEK
jgi:2-dehydro-3-deoxyphosphooctonate aldolase (KDO 8-P synthase)